MRLNDETAIVADESERSSFFNAWTKRGKSRIPSVGVSIWTSTSLRWRAARCGIELWEVRQNIEIIARSLRHGIRETFPMQGAAVSFTSEGLAERCWSPE